MHINLVPLSGELHNDKSREEGVAGGIEYRIPDRPKVNARPLPGEGEGISP